MIILSNIAICNNIKQIIIVYDILYVDSCSIYIYIWVQTK